MSDMLLLTKGDTLLLK